MDKKRCPTRLGNDEFAASGSKENNSFSAVFADTDQGFAKAIEVKEFSFPRDHGPHPDYRSEWWYFTGNLQTQAGRKFGYELTFFRFALTPEAPPSKSAWRTNQVYMAHLTLTDVERNKFYTDEKVSRAGNNLAGALTDKYQVWLYDWSAKTEGREDFPLRLRAESGEFAIDLLLTSSKSIVPQGDRGLSQKSGKPGNASYYYSYPRLETAGTVSISGDKFPVAGTSWMDREWSTSALAEEQSGWDWFALQLSDDTELMFYQLRLKDGRRDSHSSGSYILPDNTKIALRENDVVLEITDSWNSPHSK